VWNQIQLSGYDDQLLAGFVITGGGANLVGLKELIRKITRIERIKLAKPCIDIIHSKRIAEIKEKAAPHSLNTVLGLLAASEMNCAKIEAPTTGKIFEAENLIEDQETTKQDLPETKTPEQLLAEQKLIQEQEEAKKKAEKEKLEKLELQKAKEKDLEQERSKKKKKKSWKQSLFSTFEDLQKNIFDENDELK
jgi:cell division protein FtsA